MWSGWSVAATVIRRGIIENSGLVLRVHKPDAQAKDTALCQTTSRNKRLCDWFESLDPSLARQACRLEVVTFRLTRSNRAVIFYHSQTASCHNSRLPSTRKVSGMRLTRAGGDSFRDGKNEKTPFTPALFAGMIISCHNNVLMKRQVDAL